MFFRSQKTTDESWLSVSDLMAGLMMIFLFIAIIYIRPVQKQQEKIREVVVAWSEAELSIIEALRREFESDLPTWDAELDPDNLVIRFNSPEVLFSSGSSNIRPRFKKILDDFFPRYVEVLSQFEPHIEEIRIEGHTSSDWQGINDPKKAYYNNMALSQSRTRAVLEYSLEMEFLPHESDWLRSVLTANGLSSSQPVLSSGIEDRDKSRRVEFRVRTNAKQQIVKVLETLDED
jgi:outer membrane protein OmpA-like peptidoglycan-associated protein